MRLNIGMNGHQFFEGTDTISAAMPIRINDDEPSLAKFNAWHRTRRVAPPLLDLFVVGCGKCLPIPNKRLLAPPIPN
jgi:hypothetical protein